MTRVLVVGLQWGDEGKATVEEYIVRRGLYIQSGDYGIVARYSGGSNSGQTRINEAGMEVRSHVVPVGVDFDGVYSFFMSGGVIHPEKAAEEVRQLLGMERTPGEKYGITPGNLGFDGRVFVTLDYHVLREASMEERLAERNFDPTGNGIAPTYEDTVAKRGIRLGEFCNPSSFEAFLREKVQDGFISGSDVEPYVERYGPSQEFLRQFVVGRGAVMRKYASSDWVLGGAQSVMLDVFDGTYPYTTSSSSIRPPLSTDYRVGVVKLTSSRVGNGPFVSAMPDSLQDAVRGSREEVDSEFGKSTGRPRRLGWMDTFAGRFAVEAGDIDGLAMTKLDKVGELSRKNGGSLLVCTGYKYRGSPLTEFPDDRFVLEECEPVFTEMPGWAGDITGAREWGDLPQEARDYVDFISGEMGCNWDILGVGPRSEQKLVRDAKSW